MKVELQCGDTITIPEGCKVAIKDNQIIVEQEEFKDGDILRDIKPHLRIPFIVITIIKVYVI